MGFEDVTTEMGWRGGMSCNVCCIFFLDCYEDAR